MTYNIDMKIIVRTFSDHEFHHLHQLSPGSMFQGEDWGDF